MPSKVAGSGTYAVGRAVGASRAVALEAAEDARARARAARARSPVVAKPMIWLVAPHRVAGAQRVATSWPGGTGPATVTPSSAEPRAAQQLLAGDDGLIVGRSVDADDGAAAHRASSTESVPGPDQALRALALLAQAPRCRASSSASAGEDRRLVAEADAGLACRVEIRSPGLERQSKAACG